MSVVKRPNRYYVLPTTVAGAAAGLYNAKNIYDTGKSMLRTGQDIYYTGKAGYNMLPKRPTFGSRAKEGKFGTAHKSAIRESAKLRRVTGPSGPRTRTALGKRLRAKKKSLPRKQYLTKGSVFTTEYGGQVTSVSLGTAYIGHCSAPTKRVRTSAYKAMYRSLFCRAGLDFKEWTHLPILPAAAGNASAFVTNWRPNVDYVGSTQTVYFLDALNNHETNCAAWEVMMTNAIRAAAPDYFELLEVKMVHQQGSVQVTQAAILRPQITNIHITTRSRLAMQNRTEGSGLSDSATNIESNPLVGKMYGNSRNGNGFRKKGENNIGEDYTGDDNNGMIRFNSAGTQDLQKPPNGYTFGASKTTKVIMAPGAIRSSIVQWNGSKNLNALLNQATPNVVNRSTTLGKAEMLGMEKMLDVDRFGGPDIIVGFEVIATMGSYLSKAKCIVQKPGLYIDAVKIV